MLKPLLAVLLLLSCVAPATAYAWPDKPLRVIVAFPPGGMIDVFARIFQARLVEGLGQPVVVDNRPGAGGTLAEALVAKSAPDGYTMLLSADSPPANAHLYRKLDYELFRDLEPVSLLESLADLVAHARSRSTPLSYATTGSGTSNHVSMEVLKRLAGIDMTHVPYKGGPQVINDLVGGQVNSSLIALMLAAPHVRSGKMRAIALTGENRSPLLPEVQTFAQAGFPNFPPGQWCGLWLRSGTPLALTQRIHTEFAKAVRAPDAQGRLLELGAETVVSEPKEFASFVRAEHVRIGAVVREHRIVAD
jgi:tripartite-type tricarboxylate transporter receptor subunit TctC